MSNDSSTGGPLVPEAAPAPIPIQGTTLENFLHDLFVGITGIAGSLVRPRWQPEPPNLPAVNTDWLAFGIISRQSDTFAGVFHAIGGASDPSNLGYDALERQEVMNVMCSFYGPDADNLCAQLRDGLQIAQNREVLQLAKMAFVESGDINNVSELTKDLWLYRVDMMVTIRRLIQRFYPVLNINSVSGAVLTDQLIGTSENFAQAPIVVNP